MGKETCFANAIAATLAVITAIQGCSSSLPKNKVHDQVSGYWRVVTSNGVPDHPIDDPDDYPDYPGEQDLTFVMPANPGDVGDASSELPYLEPFGVALNGVVIDPHAAEWWKKGMSGERRDWIYDALHPDAPLGHFDGSNAHVQPDHTYHYHGLPTALYDRLSDESGNFVVQIGWAFDGAPIFGPYCGMDPRPASVTSGWEMKSNRDPGGPPTAGAPMGVFVRDWEYVGSAGTLDECNGHTAEVPVLGEVYHYHITTEFPMIPRCFMTRLSPIEGPTNLDAQD